MSRADVTAAIYDALAKKRASSANAVLSAIGEEGEIDSLEGVEVICMIETQFDIRVEDHELTHELCTSVERLADLITAKLG